ncbi:hypothetical protein PM082_023723 [Marasmius tenuissimus]|nr:hypothetical protein PM082_023723 [Marasmius tenuissimus]
MSHPTLSSRSDHPVSSNLESRILQIGRDFNVNSGSGIFIVNNRTKFIQGAQSIRLHIQGTEEEEEEYDQYFEYRRSDIRLLRKVHHETVWDRRNFTPLNCERSVWLAEVLSGDGKGRIVTVVSYQGHDAPEIWKNTFQRHSTGNLSAENAHLLGINRSKIPLLILLGELVPAVTFVDNTGELGQRYLSGLRDHWGCKREELWIDTARGVICRGPEGPFPYLFGGAFQLGGLDDLVLTLDLLKEDVLMRYLATFKTKKIDQNLVEGISYNRDEPDDNDGEVGMPESVDQPTVFRNSDNTPIAVAIQTWASIQKPLAERKLLGNGWLRFRLTEDGKQRFSLILNHDVGEAWISQALSIFHARGIVLEESLRECRLVMPQATLQGTLSESKSTRRLRLKQPIYLFVRSPRPSSYSASSFQYISSFHWSLQESGDPPLTLEICDNLGLPIELEFSGIDWSSMSWTAAQYKLLRQYQVLRGFDPNTTAFARHVGFNDYAFTPINDSGRFEVVHEGSPASHDLSIGAPDLKPSAIIQQTQIEDRGPSISRCDGNIDVALVHVEGKPTTSDYGSNEHQETGEREGGKEHRCIHVERVRQKLVFAASYSYGVSIPHRTSAATMASTSGRRLREPLRLISTPIPFSTLPGVPPSSRTRQPLHHLLIHRT